MNWLKQKRDEFHNFTPATAANKKKNQKFSSACYSWMKMLMKGEEKKKNECD